MKELLQIINTAYTKPFFTEEVYTALITLNRIKAIDSILELK